MNENKIGSRFPIQCYKHNGKIHRFWDEAILLDECDEYMVFGNKKTEVIESEGISWYTKEPAIMYFFKKEWYNVIVQLKKDGIYYYCNIATPFILEENVIKYIDYDLDLRIFPSGEYKVLDRIEYNYHKKIMGYSKELDKVINCALTNLIKRYKHQDLIFNKELNYKYYEQYKAIKK